MSFLAGRLAGQEGAYFYQETKHAVTRLSQKSSSPTTPTSTSLNPSSEADVLPEVLRHSLPSKIFQSHPSSSSSSSSSSFAASKWALRPNSNNPTSSSHSSDALNPLRGYVSLPQVTFGPKRWELPTQDHSVLASTANELRKDRYAPVNPQKLKAAAEGLSMVGKAFFVATALVFGGATVVFSMVASKLELHDVHNTDDLQIKGKDLVRPKLQTIQEQLVPFRTWAENTSKKWHLEKEEDLKEKPVIKELSRVLGARTSN